MAYTMGMSCLNCMYSENTGHQLCEKEGTGVYEITEEHIDWHCMSWDDGDEDVDDDDYDDYDFDDDDD